MNLARLGVDDLGLLAREVDERFLAGAMHLPHRGVELAAVALVERAEAAVAIAVRMLGDVLHPQELQRDAGPGEFPVHPPEIRLGPGAIRVRRPAQPRRPRPAQALRDRPGPDRAGPGDLPMR